ncbi:hypothetical protein [Marinicella gelatinilytica]|uniref:hypothetical protein n=1 Tax=Marinicella gelatinilytica TaxID=2996017 RepID=UPI002260C6D7|nr:hypothetical protein [Marinicella gelatinilytica]MCX7544814.1 hypothetical protein [Marinicella gelatinilytica]
MNKLFVLSLLLLGQNAVMAQTDTADVYRETLTCGESGCAVTCFQAGNRWQSFLQTAGDIELTYFLTTGARQLKAPVADGTITVLDINETCKITGVKATQP